MRHIGSVIHAKWEVGNDPSNTNRIRGYWAEDGSPYEFSVPEQLRDAILYMQNQLAQAYLENENLTKSLKHSKAKLLNLGFEV